MKLEDAHTLLSPEKLPYPSGVERLPDGTLHVAALTRMPRVRPEMFLWWFAEYLQTTEHYKRWHPRDHLWMEWRDKRPGTHIGAKHCVHETIGGRLQKLRIAFAPAEDFGFGSELEASGGVAICARTGFLERPIDIGHLVHLALPTEYGCDLHSRFWLGTIAPRTPSRLQSFLTSRPSVRRRATPTTLGRALLVHCHEEMTILSSFLPELFAAERGRAAPS